MNNYRPSLDKHSAAIRNHLLKTLQTYCCRTKTLSDLRLIIAISGGQDSMALLAAASFLSKKYGFYILAVCIDHGLQKGSEKIAKNAIKTAKTLGTDAISLKASVSTKGSIEANARKARYKLLESARINNKCDYILCAHTLDDQAETVLLNIKRGLGGGIKGMSPKSGKIIRPLLNIRRDDTFLSCKYQKIPIWNDPHNADSRFLRSNIRHNLIPYMNQILMQDIAPSLARTAHLARLDDNFIDNLAQKIYNKLYNKESASFVCEDLKALDASIALRLIKYALLEAGARLSYSNIFAVYNLIINWRGQKALNFGTCCVKRYCQQINSKKVNIIKFITKKR